MQAKPPATNKRTREIRGSYHQAMNASDIGGMPSDQTNKQTNKPTAQAGTREGCPCSHYTRYRLAATSLTALLRAENGPPRALPPAPVFAIFMGDEFGALCVRAPCVRCARSPRTVGLFSPLPSATVLQRGALCCNVVYCAATWCTAMRPRKASVTNAGPPLDVRSFVGELQLGGFDPASTATGSVSYTPIRKTSATLSSHVPSIPALLAVYDPHSRYPYPYSRYRYPFSRHLYAYT